MYPLTSNQSSRCSLSREGMGELQILISVLLFGCSFVGQKYAMWNDIGPVTYNAWRFTVSTILLLLSKPFLQSFTDLEYDPDHHITRNKDVDIRTHVHSSAKSGTLIPDDEATSVVDSTTKTALSPLAELWYWGSICGLSNYIGSVLQQESLVSISVATAGFITGMYVVVIPLVEQFVLGRKDSVTLRSWIAAICSVAGLYFISGCGGSEDCFAGAEGLGKILVFVSMFCWVISILASDSASKRVDCVSLTCIEFAICTVLNLVTALLLEPEEWVYPFASVRRNWLPILIVGITEGAAFLISTIGQMVSAIYKIVDD